MDESALVGQAQLGSQMQSQLLNMLGRSATADTPAPRSGPVDFALWASSPSKKAAGSSPPVWPAPARAADFPQPTSHYAGPRLEPLEAPVTLDWAMKLVRYFQHNERPELVKPLPARYLCRLLEEAEKHLDAREQRDGPVQQLSLRPSDCGNYRQQQFGEVKINIVGDTHGQLADLLWIFFKFGVPSPSNRYLFNGDICDRGRLAVEIWAVLLAFMCVWPESVSIQRGNHEDRMSNLADGGSGGFYDEVLSKYGRMDGVGASIYEKFAQLFARLPLAGIVDNYIFVVHGGLSRNPAGGFLRMLRANKIRDAGIPPSGNSSCLSPAELAFVDAMWSDPQEPPGTTQNERGTGLIKFGPDITAKFLQETGLQLVVRSHQVPETNRGFHIQHHGKLWTVFSASNYCGVSGNYGAVVVYGQSGHPPRPVEFYTPPWSDVTQAPIEPPIDAEATPVMVRRTRDAQRAQSAAVLESTAKQVESSPKETSIRAGRLEREVLRSATRQIVERKQDLFVFWEDCDKQKRGFISKKEWEEGLRVILGGNIPWKAVGRALRVKDTFTKDVDYRQFLSRFRVVVSGLAGGSRWAEQVLGHLYGRLLSLKGEAAALEEITGFFSRDERVSSQSALEAFRWVLGSHLTEEQAMQLLRTLAAHAGPDPSPVSRDRSLDVFEFLTRLDVVFRHQSGVVNALDIEGGTQRPPREPTPWVRSVLRHLGRLLWMEDVHGSPQAGSTRMLEIFRSHDRDGDGLLGLEEFSAAVRTLLDEYKHVLPAELTGVRATGAQMKEFFEYVDVSGDGVVAYLEFLHAFQPVDRSPGGCLRMDLMEHICTTIYANKPSLLRTMQVLEERTPSRSTHGRISREGLRQTLRSLNASLGAARGGGPQHGAPLTDMQIDILVDHAAWGADDTLDYQAFLDAFEIVDTAPPSGEEEEDETPASPATGGGGTTLVYNPTLQRVVMVTPSNPGAERYQAPGHPPMRFGALSLAMATNAARQGGAASSVHMV